MLPWTMTYAALQLTFESGVNHRHACAARLSFAECKA